MARKVAHWWTLPSWSFDPKKTFFGLGVGAHTITIPQRVVEYIRDPKMSEFLWPKESNTQNVKISIHVINSVAGKVTVCDAEIRYTNRAEDQKYLMHWDKYPETKEAIQKCFKKEYTKVKNGKSAAPIRGTFSHIAGRKFALFRTDEDDDKINSIPTKLV